MKQVENIERIEGKEAIKIRVDKERNDKERNDKERKRQKRLQIALISHQCCL